MAGVGKTRLAIHAAYLLAREMSFDHVLFVNLRGFHPDPTQPPADPAAVLDGFLRLLGVPGHQIPHDLLARSVLYRDRVAGTRALVVLDNAATAEQVRPLLPESPGCPVLVTSRRKLNDLHPAIHLAVDVFAPDEAVAFLTREAPRVPVGQDPDAMSRIARRCGYLPLALGLVTGHIRATPGWTLNDHADRLDERHHQRRLDDSVELALGLSCRHLTSDQHQLLRLAASHPGQDLDPYAAAALADTDLRTTQTRLDHLCRDHLLQQGTHGRYTFHDLVRAYAAGRSSDEDPPPERRAALTRLFDYYLAAATAAVNALHPAETHRRPRISLPRTPIPDLTDPGTAHSWLDTERTNLVAVAAHTTDHGWPTHSTRLATVLFSYLDRGHYTDAMVIHGHALHAAEHTGDTAGQGQALSHLGFTGMRLGRSEQAVEYFQQALLLFRQAGDRSGEARVLYSLGAAGRRTGHYRLSANYLQHSLALYRQLGDRIGEANALNNLGIVEERLSHEQLAVDHLQQSLALCRQTGDRAGEACALNNLGAIEGRLGRSERAADRLQQALAGYRDAGIRRGEACVLDSLGDFHAGLGQPDRATEYYQQALAILREIGNRFGEARALNGLGEVTHATGHPVDAITHHAAAHTIAADTGDRPEQARALAGLGHAYRTLDNHTRARQHYQQALSLYTALGALNADHLRADLAALDNSPAQR
jgi:tetratricopeptide (TPR) repeat protein